MKQSRGKFSPEIGEALAFAQQKYPRLFGHLSSVQNLSQAKLDPRTIPIMRTVHPSQKHSWLEIGQPTSSYWLDKYPELYSTPASVGHELLHVADNIMMPEMPVAYGDSLRNNPFGYAGSSFEYRAKNAGESFYKKFRKSRDAYNSATKRTVTAR